jgi:hypothetical protein
VARSDVRPDRIRSSQPSVDGVSRLLDKVAGLLVPTLGQVAGALAVHDPGQVAGALAVYDPGKGAGAAVREAG